MEQGTLYSAILSIILQVGNHDDVDDGSDFMSRKMKYLCDKQSYIAELVDVESLYTDQWNMDHVWHAYEHIDMVA